MVLLGPKELPFRNIFICCVGTPPSSHLTQVPLTWTLLYYEALLLGLFVLLSWTYLKISPSSLIFSTSAQSISELWGLFHMPGKIPNTVWRNLSHICTWINIHRQCSPYSTDSLLLPNPVVILVRQDPGKAFFFFLTHQYFAHLTYSSE